MIERIRNYTKKDVSKDARKIYLVCEGLETEKKYFQFFQGLSSNLELIIIPPKNGTDPIKLKELAKEKFEGENREHTLNYTQQDVVWFVIDTDTWAKEEKILPLRDFCEEKNKQAIEGFNEVQDYHPWRVCQSNPCFEIWEWYHFYDTKPTEYNREKQTFKDFVNENINGGFNFEVDPVRIEDAITHSQSNYAEQDDGPEVYSTEMHHIATAMMKFVDSEIKKLRNKLG